MNVVSAVFIVFFAIIGLVAVFREISLNLFCGKDNCTVMYITHIEADNDNVEFVLRSALAKRRWNGGKNSDVRICIDYPMNEKTQKICDRVCKEYGFHGLMTKDELIQLLSSCYPEKNRV